MKDLTFTFLDNANHGHLKISNYDLKGFNIDPSQFSNYSFYNSTNGCLYLEEDCDILKLINIFKRKDININFNEVYDPTLNPSIDFNFKRIDEINFEKVV